MKRYDKTRQDMTGQDRRAHDRVGQDSTWQYCTGLDRIEYKKYCTCRIRNIVLCATYLTHDISCRIARCAGQNSNSRMISSHLLDCFNNSASLPYNMWSRNICGFHCYFIFRLILQSSLLLFWNKKMVKNHWKRIRVHLNLTCPRGSKNNVRW